MKILILGGDGQLGSAFKKIFSEKQGIENKKFLIASSKSLLFSRVIQSISDSFGFLKTNLKFFFERR